VLLTLGRLDEAAGPTFRAAETFRTLGDIDSYVQCLSLFGFCPRGSSHWATRSSPAPCQEAGPWLPSSRSVVDGQGDRPIGRRPAAAARASLSVLLPLLVDTREVARLAQIIDRHADDHLRHAGTVDPGIR